MSSCPSSPPRDPPVVLFPRSALAITEPDEDDDEDDDDEDDDEDEDEDEVAAADALLSAAAAAKRRRMSTAGSGKPVGAADVGLEKDVDEMVALSALDESWGSLGVTR